MTLQVCTTPLRGKRLFALVERNTTFESTYKSRLGGLGSGGASFSAPGLFFVFFFSSFFNFSFGSDPIKRSL